MPFSYLTPISHYDPIITSLLYSITLSTILRSHYHLNSISLSTLFNINRRWLVTSSKDRTVRLWDLHTRTCVGLGSGHTEGVGCVTSTAKASNYRSKRTYAFSAAGDKILKRWDLRVAIAAAEAGSSDNSDTQLSSISSISSLACTHSVRGHEKDVNCVALSPNDALLASGSQDKTIRLWSASDLSAVATLRGHKRGKCYLYTFLSYLSLCLMKMS